MCGVPHQPGAFFFASLRKARPSVIMKGSKAGSDSFRLRSQNFVLPTRTTGAELQAIVEKGIGSQESSKVS